LLGDRYARLGPNRALRELQVSESARARGVATPPVKCVAWYHRALVRRSDIATRYIPSARDLADALFGADTGDAERATRAAAQLIRDMLRAGLVHSDLNLKNILVAPDRAYVVDLDKCSVEEGVSAAHSKSMRERFLRSLAKWEHATGKTVAGGLRSRLIGAFGG
jgi:tRNA A-37 threonylcarbamoyl transferase component Bud32